MLSESVYWSWRDKVYAKSIQTTNRVAQIQCVHKTLAWFSVAEGKLGKNFGRERPASIFNSDIEKLVRLTTYHPKLDLRRQLFPTEPR